MEEYQTLMLENIATATRNRLGRIEPSYIQDLILDKMDEDLSRERAYKIRSRFERQNPEQAKIKPE